MEDARQCALSYEIVCDRAWMTRWGRVSGRVGDAVISLDIKADEGRRWFINGREFPAVAGCIDLDFRFSAATNAITLRRLALEVGQSSDVTSAWLTFPGFDLEPLPQTYRRTGETTYAYEAPTLGFANELRVNPAGFVTHYPPLWMAQVH